MRVRPFAVVALLAACAVALPAQASVAQSFAPTVTAGADDAPVESVRVAVSGHLVVVQHEEFFGYGGSGASERGHDEHSHDENDRSVVLRSDDGTTIPLDPVSVPEAASGDRFDGVVAVPTEVVASAGVNAAPGETIADSTRVDAIAEEVSGSDTPVDVVDGAPQAVAERVQAGQPHTLDIAVVTPSGQSSFDYSDERLQELEPATDFWMTEARGQLGSFERGQTQRYRSAFTCADDPFDLWDEAVRRFGYNPGDYFESSGRHVALLLPPSCERTIGLGLGTVGRSLHQSGLVLLSTGFDVDTTTLTHEVGHNLGLGHSNLEFCESGSSCSTVEYADVWDVMGLAIQGWDTATRLNVEKQLALGFLTDADIPLLRQANGSSWSVQRVSLTAVDAAASTDRPNGFRVQDPDGGEYVLEYRDGEPDAFYDRTGTINLSAKEIQLGQGVRLTRAGPDMTSVATAPRTPSGTYDPAAGPGERLTNTSGSVKVDVVAVADGVAQVDISLISARFRDVAPQDQFVREISWLADRGISTGWRESDGSYYRPGLPVARNAMAAFLYRLKGSPAFTAPSVSPFVDVQPSDPFYKEISWLASKGISTGWDVGGGMREFRPYDSIARDAMAAFLFRFAEVGSYTPRSQFFADVSPAAPFYREVGWLGDKGISTGYARGSQRFYDPGASVNRDAMAAFMYRYGHL